MYRSLRVGSEFVTNSKKTIFLGKDSSPDKAAYTMEKPVHHTHWCNLLFSHKEFCCGNSGTTLWDKSANGGLPYISLCVSSIATSKKEIVINRICTTYIGDEGHFLFYKRGLF